MEKVNSPNDYEITNVDLSPESVRPGDVLYDQNMPGSEHRIHLGRVARRMTVRLQSVSGVNRGGGRRSWARLRLLVNGVPVGNEDYRSDFYEWTLTVEGFTVFEPGVDYSILAHQTNHWSTAIATSLLITIVDDRSAAPAS